jgi:hypothetical protein
MRERKLIAIDVNMVDVVETFRVHYDCRAIQTDIDELKSTIPQLAIMSEQANDELKRAVEFYNKRQQPKIQEHQAKITYLEDLLKELKAVIAGPDNAENIESEDEEC